MVECTWGIFFMGDPRGKQKGSFYLAPNPQCESALLIETGSKRLKTPSEKISITPKWLRETETYAGSWTQDPVPAAPAIVAEKVDSIEPILFITHFLILTLEVSPGSQVGTVTTEGGIRSGSRPHQQPAWRSTKQLRRY